jgi:hypothetical protein
MPSVLKANLKFLASSADFKNSVSIALHWDPSAGCLNISSTLRSSLCHRNNFCMLFVSKQTFQVWYYRSIPHHLGRESLPRMFIVTLNITKVISPDRIPRCIAYQACIQILVLLAAIEDAVIRTCMYLLDF